MPEASVLADVRRLAEMMRDQGAIRAAAERDPVRLAEWQRLHLDGLQVLWVLDGFRRMEPADEPVGAQMVTRQDWQQRMMDRRLREAR